MKKIRLFLLLLAAAFLLPAAAHAQYVNSNPVPDANFNATTPSANAGYVNCSPQNSGRNVTIQCPSGQSAMNVLTYSTTPAINLALGTTVQFACTTAGAAIVPTISGYKAGLHFTVIFVQNGATACTWAWPSTVHAATAVSSTLSSVSSQEFVVSNNGTDAFAVAAGTACTSSCGTP
jgi:hypothetical protein